MNDTAEVDKEDLRVAGRNAITLAFSLVGTWSVAFLVRFQLPRFLGPIAFGDFNFAEAFTATFFVLADFGIDTYIVKETAAKPAHASDFAGGVLVVRTAASAMLLAVMAATLGLSHRSADVQLAVLVFGVTQFVMLLNSSMAAMLQAATRVRRLAAVNVLSKVLWGAGLAIVILLHGSLPVLALPLLISEAVKLVLLVPGLRSAIGLRLRIDKEQTKRALKQSLPYFLNIGAVTVGNRLTVSALEFVTPDKREVGWYGASANLAGLAMLLAPLYEWVLMPLLARAKERSEEAVYAIARRALEGLLAAVIPFTLFVSLGADLWIRIAFGSKFGEAATSLSVLSLDFSLVYVAMLMSTVLIMVGRSWSVTLVSLSAVPMRALLIAPLVSVCATWLGPGGAAVGAALTEIGGIGLTALVSFLLIGRRAIDARAVGVIARSLAIAVVVWLVHHALTRFGYFRILLDVALYLVLAIVLRVVTMREVRGLADLWRSRRNAKAAPTEPPSP